MFFIIVFDYKKSAEANVNVLQFIQSWSIIEK